MVHSICSHCKSSGLTPGIPLVDASSHRSQLSPSSLPYLLHRLPSVHGEPALELAGTHIKQFIKGHEKARAPLQIQESFSNIPVWMGML